MSARTRFTLRPYLPTGKLAGSLLIELIISGAIISVGFLVVYLGFTQVNRASTRNDLKSVALNVLSTHIDTDAKTDYANLAVGSTTTPVTDLPGGMLDRTIIGPASPTQPAIKTIKYTLSWESSSGRDQVSSEYELIEQGIIND